MKKQVDTNKGMLFDKKKTLPLSSGLTVNPENGLSDRVLLHRPVDCGAGQHLRVQLRRCCDRLRDRTVGRGGQVGAVQGQGKGWMRGAAARFAVYENALVCGEMFLR